MDIVNGWQSADFELVDLMTNWSVETWAGWAGWAASGFHLGYGINLVVSR